MSDVQGYIGRELSRFTEEILEFLRIPSVSAKSEHNPDTRRAAEWLRDRMEGADLEADVLETAGHPVVLGEWRGAGADDDGRGADDGRGCVIVDRTRNAFGAGYAEHRAGLQSMLWSPSETDSE